MKLNKEDKKALEVIFNSNIWFTKDKNNQCILYARNVKSRSLKKLEDLGLIKTMLIDIIRGVSYYEYILTSKGYMYIKTKE